LKLGSAFVDTRGLKHHIILPDDRN
jgi:hypothetical protein